MDYEIKERLKALIENMKSYGYIDGVEELESIFPELRESEDERIRKELIEFIQWSVDRHFMREDFHQAKRPSEWITYLKKQKEQKPSWKPTETDVALFNKAVTTNKTLTPTERAQLDIIRSKFGYCRAVNCNGIVQKEQKPAWSEEDERMLSRCIKSIECSKMFAEAKTFKDAKDNEINWLKNRFKFLKSQPNPEWSEEDEKRVKQLIYDTEHIRAEYEKRKKELGESFNDELIKDCDEQIAWLKSLRPSWKPSEEQMEELWNVISYIEQPDSNYLGVPELLESLYEQLKKL